MTPQRKPVLLFSRNPELLGNNLRLVTHVNILKSAPQTIMNDRVYNLAIAHAVPRARLRQQVRSIAHALHAAGHKRLLIARAYRLRRQHHSLQAGATDLIHSKRRNIDRKPRVNRGLSRRRLSNTRRDYIPHNNFVDGIRRNARAPYGLFYHQSPQLGSCETGKSAKKFTGRRSRRPNNYSNMLF